MTNQLAKITKGVLLASMLAFGLQASALGVNSTQGDITIINSNTTSGTATTASTVAMDLALPPGGTIFQDSDARYNTVGIMVSGTFTGTLTFQSSFDGAVTWVSHTVATAPITATLGTLVTSATSTGKWFANVAGVTNFRVTATAAMTGTATVTLTRTRGPALLTVATLPSLTTTNASVQTVAASTGTSMTLAGGAVTTAAPTYTTGQADPLSLDTAGALRVGGAFVGATAATVPASALLQGGSVTTSAPTYTNGQMSAMNLTTLGSQRMDIHSLGGTAVAADGATIAGTPVPIAHKAVADGAAPTQVSAGQAAYGLATLERIPIVSTRHPNHIQCQQTISTATSLTAMGGSCAAPASGLSIYVTDIDFSTNAAGIAADSFNTLKMGTGGTCGASTAVVWQCMTAAATQATCSSHLTSPIKLTAQFELCWINSTAGSKTVNIQGYIAP